MEDRIAQLERAVKNIEDRNARVERDKAWETSLTRILLVSGLTYFVAVLVFWMLGNQQFFLSALIPTIGFVLSVQSASMVKKWWIEKYRK